MRGSMCLTPTWPSWSAAPTVSASTSSGWGAYCGLLPTSAPEFTSSYRSGPSKSPKHVGGERALLPASLLRYSTSGDRVVPHFFGEADHPWLRALIDEALRFVGRRRRELEERLREPLLPAPDVGKQRLAAHVLKRAFAGEGRATALAKKIRAALFGAASRSSAPRAAIVTTAAASLGMAPKALEDLLFSDLPGERTVVAPAQPISPLELALRANLALAQGLLFRAQSVTVEVEGHARPLVRHAKLRGLICLVDQPAEDAAAQLRISGPLALFRRT